MGLGNRTRQTAPLDYPEARVFRPTMEEFADFYGYIKKIESEGAHLAGICKIIPPDEWIPRKKGYDPETFDFKLETPLKQTFSQMAERGSYQTKCMSQEPMTVKEYHEMATNSTYRTPPHASHEELERKYWRNLNFVPPIYGADVAQSITDPEVKEFNIAKLDSILKLINEKTDQVFYGVNSPYLYFGMWKATFSWHVEDMDLYGINFVHHGAPKTWYCVPPKYGHLLEKAARTLFPNVASWCSNFMRHKTCLISPHLLDELGVPYQKMVQEERHMIIVFPYAYHSGFNHGFNIAESTNFATERWIEYGKRHRPCDCSRNKVKIDMGLFVKEYQPERYDAWMAGSDIAPHPEDPPELAAAIRERAKDPEAYARMIAEKVQAQRQAAKQDEPPPDPNSEMEMMDLYQHVEMKHFQVTVYPGTLKCTGSGLDRLREMLGRPMVTLKDALDSGEMIKVGQQPKLKKPRPEAAVGVAAAAATATPMAATAPAATTKAEAPPHKREMVEKSLSLSRYKHACLDLYVTVDPATMELLEEPPDVVKRFLSEASMAELIEIGVFQKFDDFVETYREMATGEAKPQHNIPATASLAAKLAPKYTIKLRLLDIYEHRASGLRFKVCPTTRKLTQGSPNSKMRELLDGRPISQMIDERLVEKVGVTQVKQKVLKKNASPVKSAPAAERLPPAGKEGEGEDVVEWRHLYRHRTVEDLTIEVIPKTMKTQGRKGAVLTEALAGRTVQEAIEAGDFELVGKRQVQGNRTPRTPKTPRAAQKVSGDESQTMRIKSYTLHWKGNKSNISVAVTGNRVVYSFEAGQKEVRELCASHRLEELLKPGTLQENQEPIRHAETLMRMAQLKKVAYDQYAVKGFKRSTVLVNVRTQDILKKHRQRYCRALMQHSVADLVDTNVLTDKAEVLRLEDADPASQDNKEFGFEFSAETSTGYYEMQDLNRGYLVREESGPVKVSDDEQDDDLGNDDDEEEDHEVSFKVENEPATAPVPTPEPVSVPEPEQKPIPTAPTPAKKEEPSYDYDSSDFFDSDEEQMEMSDEDDGNSSSSSTEVYSSDDPDFLYGQSAYAGRKRKKCMSKKERKEQAKKQRLVVERKERKRTYGEQTVFKGHMQKQMKAVCHLMRTKEKTMRDNQVDKPVFLNPKTVVSMELIDAEILDILMLFFKNFGVVDAKPNEEGCYLWHGVSTERMRVTLTDILDGRWNQETGVDEDEVWRYGVEILNITMRAQPDAIFSVSQMACRLYRMSAASHYGRAEKIRTIVDVLITLNLLKRRVAGDAKPATGRCTRGGNLYYNGPNVFAEWEEQQLAEHNLARCHVLMDRSSVSREVLREYRGQQRGNKNSSGMNPHTTNIQLRLELLKKHEGKLTAEQERSVKYAEMICKCGHKLSKKVNGKVTHAGFKKRSRCKNCVGCKAPKCMSCGNCLNPQRKQACVGKLCIFPIVPKCPCFP